MYNFNSHNDVQLPNFGFEMENCMFLIPTSILGLLQNFPVYCMKFLFFKASQTENSSCRDGDEADESSGGK